MQTGQSGDGLPWMNWLAFVGGDRPGAWFHEELRIGDLVSVRIGRTERVIDAALKRCEWEGNHLTCVGDETAIGLFASLADLPRIDKQALLVLPDSCNSVVPRWGQIEVHSFGSCAELVAALSSTHGSSVSLTSSVLIVGEKSLVRSVRSAVQTAGVSNNRIAACVYWAHGKVGPE
jgi:NADPH-dependent ferric siderophore reductase